MTRLFTYKPVGDNDKHRVIYEDDPRKAEELISSGKATRLDLPVFDEMQNKANELYESHKRAVEKMKASDNPIHTDEVKAYEVDKMEQRFQEESAAIETEYLDWRGQQLDEAKAKAARAVIKVSNTDKDVAEQFVTRASLNLAAAFDDDKYRIVKGIIDDIGLLTDEEKTAMQSQIGALLGGLDQSDKRALVNAVQDTRNADLLSVKVAEQLPRTVLAKQRMEEIVRSVVTERDSLF